MSATSSDLTPASSSEEASRTTDATQAPVHLTSYIRRSRLSRPQVMHLIARRYGSLHDFSQVVARYSTISTATGIHQDTVRKAIQLFHKKGNRYERTSMKGRGGGRPRAIPPDLEAELVTWESLNEMRFLSLRRRAELIRRAHGINVGAYMLANLYRRNGIRYLQAKKWTRVSDAKEQRLERERVAFAQKLRGL